MSHGRRGFVRSIAALALLCGAIALAAVPRQVPRPASEDAYRANNLGVAYLEQYNYDEAAKYFRRALELGPELHITRVNLALALLYAGAGEDALTTARQAEERLPSLPQSHYVAALAARSLDRGDDAVAAFRKVLELDPDDVGSRVNLGQIFVQQRQYTDAVRVFREALDRQPYNVTAAYGLATALTRSAAGDAAEAMRRFNALRDQPYGVTYSNSYLEQGRYGEAIASTGAEAELVDPSPPPVAFADATATVLPGTVGAARAQTDAMSAGAVMLFDADGDGDLDALLTERAAVRLYANTDGVLRDVSDAAGLRALSFDAYEAVAADYDNDGRADVLLLTAAGVRLLHRTAGARYEDVTTASGLRGGVGARTAAFVDIDHDGDVDLVIAGASTTVFRNNGDQTFADITAATGIGAEMKDGLAIAPTDFDDRRDVDVLILGREAGPRLFQNMRDGTFRNVATRVGLPSSGRFTALAAADLTKDGLPDFLLARSGAAALLAVSDGGGRYTMRDAPAGTSGAEKAQFVDYDNDGLLDLITWAGSAVHLFRNIGSGWSDVTSRAGLDRLTQAAGTIRSIAFGDIDGDGDTDAVLLTTAGVRCWTNGGGTINRSLAVRLTGRVSNRGGIGAKVDLRAGSLRQRLETSAVTPALRPADLVFGLGSRSSADVVRVIWPSGTLQAEPTGDSRAVTVVELDRKPSSCPYLYTWNGSRFEFLTDFMGGGEMGHWEAPGVWSTPDPDEYVRIPPGKLLPRDGRLEIRVTNELEETMFADRLQLVAIDHRSDAEIFPNEGLGSPLAGPLSITAIGGARAPERAYDEHGHDVLDRIARIDRRYPDDFGLTRIRGYAEEHALTIDGGTGAPPAVLLATGWTDYAFSADNIAASQQNIRLMLPRLEVKTRSGAWRTAIENIGIPVGRPQTILVDLRKALRPGEHEFRIRTNMRIYWDQVLMSRDAVGAGPQLRISRLDPSSAVLHWRGFSEATTTEEPLAFDYDRVSRISPWKTMIGRYTREGDVRELLTSVDDRFVIARPGDEIALSFDGATLPTLAAGHSRTFLLYADGFSKEMDITSASPHTVLPLPFHAMANYPYGAAQHYPSGAFYREYQDRYNTRVVSRPVPPMEIAAGR
jgi:tetratricopeptide (TPR) repeat protein